MKNLAELEIDVWKQINAATTSHDARRLAYFSALANEMQAKKVDWISRIEEGLRTIGKYHPEGRSSVPTRPARTDGDFTGRPIRAFEFEGVEVLVSTYKELLVRLANLLRKKYGEEFDRCATVLGGRKRRYFSTDRRELKYAHELDHGGFFVETNLNANLIVKICYSILRELGCDEGKLRIR